MLNKLPLVVRIKISEKPKEKCHDPYVLKQGAEPKMILNELCKPLIKSGIGKSMIFTKSINF